MGKSASIGDLQELHSLIAQSLNSRIKQDMVDSLPTDAATLGAAIKFLKDNNVSADPADRDDLTELRENLRRQSEARKNKRSNVIDLMSGDLKAAEG